MRTIFFSYFLLFCFSLTALLVQDPNLSFHAPPKEKPSILGISLSSTPREVTDYMSPYAKSKPQKKPLTEKSSYILTFQGLPPGLPIDGGSSHFVFHQNHLAKIVFTFNPSYHGLLVLRSELAHHLESQFDLSEKHEMIDPLLKTELAHLTDSTLQQKAEQKIQSSIEQGKTYFSYLWQDPQEEISISLQYLPHPTNRKATLALHYNYLPMVQKMRLSPPDKPKVNLFGNPKQTNKKSIPSMAPIRQ